MRTLQCDVRDYTMTRTTLVTDLSAIRIRHIEYDLRQRFCLKCGKILPLIIPKYYTHECVMPDFVKDKLNNE